VIYEDEFFFFFFFKKGYKLLWVRRSTLILLNVTSYVDTRKVRNLGMNETLTEDAV
jgi:hypothetical protein